MKVTVIVPTYRTPQFALDRLVTSLDRQTMPQEDFEILFVDDGSPDRTVQRIDAMAVTRPHIRVIRVANSGWPSKPRNVGIDQARGKYIAFMDHDDELYPDALRAAYAFAVANGSDVVNGKEAYTHKPGWALALYTEDQAQSIGRTDVHPLVPMNPHKLYRRAFLLEHGIRFPEGRRVLWEDQFFNLQAGRHAKVISTLSSVPYYHWFESKGGGSDTAFAKWTDDYWHWYRRVLLAIVAQTPEESHAREREQLMHNQYTARVLGAFDGGYGSRPDEACAFIFDHAKALREEFGLSRFDARLAPSQRARAYLLDHGDAALMKLLCVEDRAIQGFPQATAVRWDGGVLHVSAEIHWRDHHGAPLTLHREGERIIRRLSDELDAALPPEVRDWTAHVAGLSVSLTIRHRDSRISWGVPSRSAVQPTASADGALTLVGTLEATVAPSSAAMGNALESGVWDLAVASTFSGHKALRSDVEAVTPAAEGRLHRVYPDGGKATLVVDAPAESFSAEGDGTGTRRVLLLTDRDSDDAGGQLAEACTLSLLRGAASHLGLPEDAVAIESRSVGIVPTSYLTTHDPALLSSAEAALSTADLLVLGGARDDERTAVTLELARQHGVPALVATNPVSVADIVFPSERADDVAPASLRTTLKDRVPSRAKALIRRLQGRPAPKKEPARRAVVGLVVTRARVFRDNGISFSRKRQDRLWLDVIAALTAHGHDYRLITTGHFADETYLGEFTKKHAIPSDKVTPGITAPEELVAALRGVDAVISFRASADAAAFALGIPSVGLSCEPSMPQFYASVGYPDRALGPDRWTGDEVVAALTTALSDGVRTLAAAQEAAYSQLFAGLKEAFGPEGPQRPHRHEELRRSLPTHPGTTPEQYVARLERKLRRIYDAAAAQRLRGISKEPS